MDTQFIQYLPQLPLLKMQAVAVKMVGAVKNSLFMRGKAMSGAPVIRGTSQLLNPPIRMGITMKKVITKAWAVLITL